MLLMWTLIKNHKKGSLQLGSFLCKKQVTDYLY